MHMIFWCMPLCPHANNMYQPGKKLNYANKLYSAHDRWICPSVQFRAGFRLGGATQRLTHEPRVQIMVMASLGWLFYLTDLTVVSAWAAHSGLVALPVICQNSQSSNNQVKVTDLWSPRRNCWVEVRLWCGAVGVVVLEQKPTTNIWRLSGQVSGLSHFTFQDALHRKLSEVVKEHTWNITLGWIFISKNAITLDKNKLIATISMVRHNFS